jgi:hypothetical protein
MNGARSGNFSEEFFGKIVSAHRDSVEPELILARPLRWFKVIDVRSLNGIPIKDLDEFKGL